MIEGGVRDRMVFESIRRFLFDHLESLGWLDSGRHHLPLNLVDAYPGEVGEVPLNTVAFSMGDSYQTLLELGSKAESHFAPAYVDIYGESAAVMRHILGDLYLHVNKNPVIPVYNWDLATPVVDFNLTVLEESAEKTYPTNVTNAWQKYWGILTFIVEDDRPN